MACSLFFFFSFIALLFFFQPQTVQDTFYTLLRHFRIFFPHFFFIALMFFFNHTLHFEGVFGEATFFFTSTCISQHMGFNLLEGVNACVSLIVKTVLGFFSSEGVNYNNSPEYQRTQPRTCEDRQTVSQCDNVQDTTIHSLESCCLPRQQSSSLRHPSSRPGVKLLPHERCNGVHNHQTDGVSSYHALEGLQSLAQVLTGQCGEHMDALREVDQLLHG